MDSELEEKIVQIKKDKPTFPISTSNKLAMGLLSLVFSIALAFVYVEERHRIAREKLNASKPIT